MVTYRFVILVSANSEWRAAKQHYQVTETGTTPFGETFDVLIEGEQVLFLHSGWGKTTTAAATQYAIDHYHPALITNVGSCGGLQGKAEVGQMLLVDSCVQYDIYESMTTYAQAIDHYRVNNEYSWITAALPGNTYKAPLASADQDIQPSQVIRLMEEFGVGAADWETASFAWVAQRNQVSWLALRVVTDLVSSQYSETTENAELWRERVRAEFGRLLDTLPFYLSQFKQNRL